jgi:hypothetical protein
MAEKRGCVSFLFMLESIAQSEGLERTPMLCSGAGFSIFGN